MTNVVILLLLFGAAFNIADQRDEAQHQLEQCIARGE